MAIGEGKSTLPRIKQVGMDAFIVEQKPLPEDHPFYAIIGRVAAEWARFEHILDQIIWDLAKGKPNILSCITGQIMSYNARIKIIQALAKHQAYDAATVKKINELNKDLYELAEERNRYVHDAWFVQESGVFASQPGQFKSITPKNKKFGFTIIERENAIDVIKKIQDRAEMASAVRSLLLEKATP